MSTDDEYFDGDVDVLESCEDESDEAEEYERLLPAAEEGIERRSPRQNVHTTSDGELSTSLKIIITNYIGLI